MRLWLIDRTTAVSSYRVNDGRGILISTVPNILLLQGTGALSDMGDVLNRRVSSLDRPSVNKTIRQYKAKL